MKANLQIKRSKYQGSGPVERFLKKKGYGGARIAKESIASRFREVFQSNSPQICFISFCKG